MNAIVCHELVCLGEYPCSLGCLVLHLVQQAPPLFHQAHQQIMQNMSIGNSWGGMCKTENCGLNAHAPQDGRGIAPL